MAAAKPPMRLVTQTDDTNDGHWDNCWAASAAMAVFRLTGGLVKVGWREIRQASGKPDTVGVSDGGSVADSMAAARKVLAAAGFDFLDTAQHRPGSYAGFLVELGRGRGAWVAGKYDKLERRYRQQDRAAFGHAVYVESSDGGATVDLYDPLIRAGQPPVKVPVGDFSDFYNSMGGIAWVVRQQLPALADTTLRIDAGTTVQVARIYPDGRIAGWDGRPFADATSAPATKPVIKAGIYSGHASVVYVRSGPLAKRWVRIGGGTSFVAR